MYILRPDFIYYVYKTDIFMDHLIFFLNVSDQRWHILLRKCQGARMGAWESVSLGGEGEAKEEHPQASDSGSVGRREGGGVLAGKPSLGQFPWEEA